MTTVVIISIMTGCSTHSKNAQETDAQKSAKRGKVTVTIYDRGNIPSGQGTVENNLMTKWINQAGPVDVTFIPLPRTQSDQKLNNPNFVVQGNELIHGWDNMQAVTAFKKRLYNEGLVDKEFYIDKYGAKAKRDFLNGKIGIYMDQFNVPITFYNDFYVGLKKSVPDAELAIMPYPTTPVGRFNPIFVNPIQMTGVVNAETKDPEAVMKYVDFAASETFMKTMYYGFEGVHSKTLPGECPQVTDLNKWQKEFNYASGDFGMLASPTLAGKCYFGVEKMDTKDPLQQEVKKMFEANSSFIDFNLQMAGPTHSEQMPQLSKDLQQILTDTMKQVDVGDGDIWMKAILTPNYSPEQAKKDAIAVWEKAGGAQVDAWYKAFYEKDKDTIILSKDIYDIFKQQRALQNK
ncbi:hypothetical protein LJR153_005729 [Paenibacillus sp. LjRoot153]